MFKKFDENVFADLKFDNTLPGARINHGTVLLAWYIRTFRNVKRIAELGAGSGAVSIKLAKENPNREITAFEIDKNLCEVAKTNCIWNKIVDNISIVNLDITGVKEKYSSGYFDMIVSNPPHYIHSGLESPDESRNKARRMNDSEVKKFIKASAYLLKTRGIFFFVLHPRDLLKWTRIMESTGMGIHRLRFVYGKSETQAQLVLLQGRMASSSDLIVEPPVVLRKGR